MLRVFADKGEQLVQFRFFFSYFLKLIVVSIMDFMVINNLAKSQKIKVASATKYINKKIQ